MCLGCRTSGGSDARCCVPRSDAVSPEVTADAAEPPEVAVLSSVPCLVVTPSNALSTCPVMVEGTIVEVSEFVKNPDGTAVKPPEVSIVSTFQPSACPVTAKEANNVPSFAPIMAF